MVGGGEVEVVVEEEVAVVVVVVAVAAVTCPCGSIISGHRRATEVMMPLSTEKASVGSPWMFH